ncbi:hypothetical protein ACFL2T_02550 [Elusimicrobiota bacterium]
MGDAQIWIEWGRGPLFKTCLAFMILGLARRAIMTLWDMAVIGYRAGDKVLPWRQVVIATLKWMFLVEQLRNRMTFGLTTLAFHVSIIVLPVFLAGHIALWERGIGLSWPAIPNSAADVLTAVAVLSALLLMLQRLVARDSRALSRAQDYAIPLIVAAPFVTGFFVMHPAWNPFSYETALLAHVYSADLLILLIPVSKLSHMVLLPSTQLVSELAWHFPPDAGSKVAVALGKENEPI